MPIYLYRCDCKEIRDIIHGMSESPKVNCLVCRGDMVRVPQAPSVSFQGSGFYSTDKNSPKK